MCLGRLMAKNEEIISKKLYSKSPVCSVNRYCSKLPSDTFTRLTPLYGIDHEEHEGHEQYVCQILLPINCPIRKAIKGAPEATVEAAQYSAAMETCKQLRSIDELDENMMPLGRESSKSHARHTLTSASGPTAGAGGTSQALLL